MKIAILGAESTGKTQLAHDLANALHQQNKTVVEVPEVLREWCGHNGRTPRPHEQSAIAVEQARRVESASPSDFLIVDTTALMTAIYSDLLFGDRSLYAFALEHHQRYDLTLVMGLDLPWVADGIQRDGPEAREPVDARLRQVLADKALNYTVIYGSGAARTQGALQAIASYGGMATSRPRKRPSLWKWSCEKCSDAECEHRMFTDRLRMALLKGPG